MAEDAIARAKAIAARFAAGGGGGGGGGGDSELGKRKRWDDSGSAGRKLNNILPGLMKSHSISVTLSGKHCEKESLCTRKKIS